MALRSHRFIVHTVFCDGFDTHREFGADERADAYSEYADGLRLAVDPPKQERIALSANTDLVGSVPKHVRQVTLLVYDVDDNLIHHIDSGIFPCEDRALAEV